MTAATAASRLIKPESAAPRAVPRALVWCDTTAAVPFETGIQRVTRRLARSLQQRGMHVVPVGWEPRSRLMAALSPGEPARGGPHPLGPAAGQDGAPWLLVPEIPMTALGDGLDPVQLARAYGLRAAAVVHDLIPLRRPGDYGAAALDLYRRYFRSFAGADLVLATTEHVAGHLRAHLASEGLSVPPTAVVPLPAQFADWPRVDATPLPRGLGGALRLLTVSTWEPRKNGPALVRAVEAVAGQPGRPAVHLTVVGRRGGFPAYDAAMLDLLAAAPPGMVRVLDQGIGDAELAALYGDHHASVYPSVEEGFGLPVGESLWLGRPCVCHARSAMAEVAPGGGTLTLDMTDEGALAASLARLADEADLLPRLAREITARPLRSWSDYAADVAALLR